MSEYSCIIADDEPLARQLMKSYVEKVPYLTLKGVFKNAWEVKAFLASKQVDLLLLDIEMPGLDGITMVKSITNVPYVIFVTAHRNYAVEAFEVRALDYLLKPISFERFLKAIYPIEQTQQTKVQPAALDHLFISVDRQMVKIRFREMLYLEAMGDYVKFYLADDKPILSKITLKNIMQQVDPQILIQIHRSFVVNKAKITAYTQDKVKIADVWLKVSRSYKAGLGL